MSIIHVITRVLAHWFWSTVDGTLVHKLLVRVLYFPSIWRMCLLEGPKRRWYDRIDNTVILGALPFRSQAQHLVDVENVRTVISFNEAYELNYFTSNKNEWAALGVDRYWFSTIDFQPPSLDKLSEGVKIVEGVKAKSESVYVHCKAGKGRSTTMVACYLMKDRGFTPTGALDYIRARRPQISVNERQQKRLAEFHSQLRKNE